MNEDNKMRQAMKQQRSVNPEEMQTPAPRWILKPTDDGHATVEVQALRALLDETFGAEYWSILLDAPARTVDGDEGTASATARIRIRTTIGTIERSAIGAVPIERSMAQRTPPRTVALALEEAATRAFVRATACLGPRFGSDVESTPYDALCERAQQASTRATEDAGERIDEALARPVPPVAIDGDGQSQIVKATMEIEAVALNAHRIDPATSETWYEQVSRSIRSWAAKAA